MITTVNKDILMNNNGVNEWERICALIVIMSNKSYPKYSLEVLHIFVSLNLQLDVVYCKFFLKE